MSDMMDITHTHSPESEIDRDLENLIGKIVEGTATREDRIRFAQLASQRTRMMQPKVTAKHGMRRRYA